MPSLLTNIQILNITIIIIIGGLMRSIIDLNIMSGMVLVILRPKNFNAITINWC